MSNIIFVSGGVRSGKSSFAEHYLTNQEGNLVYIATAIAYDDEMKKRVERHQQVRQGNGWTTYEKSTTISELGLKKKDIVLLDCLTNLVANELYLNKLSKEEAVTKIFEEIVTVSKQVKELVIVSNDVFSEIASYSSETKDYIEVLGRLHCLITRITMKNYELVYSLPREMNSVELKKEGEGMTFIFGGVNQGKLTMCKHHYPAYKVHDVKTDGVNLSPQSIVYNFEELVLDLVNKNEDPVKFFKQHILSTQDIIIIGTEMGQGIVPIKKEHRLLRDHLGFLYQEIVKQSDEVYRVWNGIAEKLK